MAARAESRGAERGRRAEQPSELPAAGWRDILWRVKGEMAEDNLSLVAAGVAFYALLALFPAIAAVVSIYGMIVDPQTVEQQLAAVSHILPQEAQSIVGEQLRRVTGGGSTALGFGAILQPSADPVERQQRYPGPDHGSQHRLRRGGEARLRPALR